MYIIPSALSLACFDFPFLLFFLAALFWAVLGESPLYGELVGKEHELSRQLRKWATPAAMLVVSVQCI